MVSDKGFLQTMDKNCKAPKKQLSEFCGLCGATQQRLVRTRTTQMKYTKTYLNVFINEIMNEDVPFCDVICTSCFVLLKRINADRYALHKLETYLHKKYYQTKKLLTKNQKPIPQLIYNSLANVDKMETGTTLNICDQLSVTVYHKTSNGVASSVEESNNLMVPCDISITKENRNKCSANRVASKKRPFSAETNSIEPSYNGKKRLLHDPVQNASPKLEMGLTSSVLSQGLEMLASVSQEFPSYSTDKEQSSPPISNQEVTNVECENNSEVEPSPSALTNGNLHDSCSSNESSSDTSDHSSLGNSKAANSSKNSEIKNETNSTEAFDMNPELMPQAALMQNLVARLISSFVDSSLWMGPVDRSDSPKDETIDDFTAETILGASDTKQDKKKRLELKNTGQSYINTKGKLISAKKVSYQDCSRCPLKCNNSLSEEDRLKVFSEYWGLGNYELQKEYLANHMHRIEKVASTGLIRTSIKYFLSYNGDKVQVCRQFFLKTLDVSEKSSRIVLKRQKQPAVLE